MCSGAARRFFVQRCSTLPFLRSVPQAAPGCGVSAPALGFFLCSGAAPYLFKEECRLPAAGDAGYPPPPGGSLFGCTKRDQKCI
ncbi:hypothetical protein D7Y41_31890 [Anaerotruncus sp. 1XD22-93]|nr:hypothetical protein D7Y41_31890 [Anaerotruncus sp. 1XD22-93]